MILLDVLGFLFGVFGAILVTYKNKYGFISFIVSSAIYAIIGVVTGLIGLASCSVVFIVIDIYAFIKWTKQEKVL